MYREKVKCETKCIRYKQPKRHTIYLKTQLWITVNYFISLRECFSCTQMVNLITIQMFETLWYNKSPRITCLLNRFPSLSKYIIDQLGHGFRSTVSSLFFEFEICQDVLDNSDKHHCSAADSSQNWHRLSNASLCPSSQPTSRTWQRSCLLPTKSTADSTALKYRYTILW